MNIFLRSHYTEVIKDFLKQNASLRGYQSRLAEAAGVHNSYLSRVVNDQVFLTPDQAALLCGFWNFTTDETDFFIALVHLARAGSKELKTVLKRQVEDLKKKHEDLAHRFDDAKSLGLQGQGLYYSAWYYSAIHFLLLVPGFQTSEKISERLSLPLGLTLSALETLMVLGLVKQEGKKWIPVISNLHMSNQSLWAPIYHSCYRQKVAYKVHERSPKDMHFTGLHAMSEKDFLQVKSRLQDVMEEVRALALPSAPEDLYGINVDWFRV